MHHWHPFPHAHLHRYAHFGYAKVTVDGSSNEDELDLLFRLKDAAWRKLKTDAQLYRSDSYKNTTRHFNYSEKFGTWTQYFKCKGKGCKVQYMQYKHMFP